MNYFAHGYQYTDRPWFLIGTAVPDLLSACDRRVRMRPRGIEPVLAEADQPDAPIAQLAAGILQHLHDDQWFHRTYAFHQTTGELARLFCQVLDGESTRSGFLGHITMELLLDAVLMEREPAQIDVYYAAVRQVDPNELQRMVNRMSPGTSTKLSGFVQMFAATEFLRDYLDSNQLLYRLNQVMHRVKLQPLPPATVDVLDQGRMIVRQRMDELLQSDRRDSPRGED